ncbi:ubiquinone biosynthesis O-methyltransferase, mitochondrial [Neodiprion virginianus]|uniref:ubiquinone biosynthesis O-methyltransferase, mitochondrial n=1 Tax=Neodiprion virginianus TaxID=2961670 RepID=UPI001EE6B879|nr:ubiquinone biosynthesis O-methyltransferase, mitochondrial [Neodiprion virginianus]
MRSVRLFGSFKTSVKKHFSSTAQSTKAFEDAAKSGYSTVDSTDIEHHSKLSHKWWDTAGELKALHSLNTLRIQFIRDGLANTGITSMIPSLPLSNVKILDVGCGGGILSEPLARIGADVTGIDASSELIKTATEHATLDINLSERLQYISTSIEEHSQSNYEKYDAVVSSEVLEHVADKELFLKCCTAAMRPGGSLFLTTINKSMASLFGAIIAAEYILRLVPQGTHDWNKFVSPNEVRRILESAGCQTKLIHGMCYNPLTNEWSWMPSTVINYALHAVKREEL